MGSMHEGVSEFTYSQFMTVNECVQLLMSSLPTVFQFIIYSLQVELFDRVDVTLFVILNRCIVFLLFQTLILCTCNAQLYSSLSFVIIVQWQGATNSVGTHYMHSQAIYLSLIHI